MSKLHEIQQKLKAPKGQYNNFGKYKYRSCEDILEAVKPILKEVGCTLILSDEMVQVGDRYYIKATAHLKGENTDETTTAYAREDAEKKGMDGSQITGTASSYARKYALNGLFCIDDTKDADTDEYANQTGKQAKPSTPAPATPAPATPAKEIETKDGKQVFDPRHPLWNAALKKMANGKGSIAELQKVYFIPAHAETAITEYLKNNIKQN